MQIFVCLVFQNQVKMLTIMFILRRMNWIWEQEMKKILKIHLKLLESIKIIAKKLR